MTLNVRDQVRQLESRINELGTRTPETPVSTPAPGAVTPAEPVAPAVEPAAVAPPPVAPAPATSTTLEEKFGTQWVVWIGGLALALGGIFLVRFTIEQGLLGPGVRIFLAGVFSALLIAAGEWARRNEIAAGIAAIPKQHIPSILTADCRICNRLCCICALWFSVAGCRFRPARPRGSGHIGSSIAAWACACRSRHSRSLHYTFARPFGESELLGALYLSGNGDGGGICAGTTAPLALAGGRRRCAWCPLDAAWRRISERHGIGRASVSCRGWLRPCGDVDRVRFTVRSFRRSRKNR